MVIDRERVLEAANGALRFNGGKDTIETLEAFMGAAMNALIDEIEGRNMAAIVREEKSKDSLDGMWLPIKTAPKDGDWIIGYGGISGYNQVGPIRWDGWFWTHEMPMGGDDDLHTVRMDATHWMPMPRAPLTDMGETAKD